MLGRGTQSPVQFGITRKKTFAPEDASQVQYTYLFLSTPPPAAFRLRVGSNFLLGILGKTSTELLCLQPRRKRLSPRPYRGTKLLAALAEPGSCSRSASSEAKSSPSPPLPNFSTNFSTNYIRKAKDKHRSSYHRNRRLIRKI